MPHRLMEAEGSANFSCAPSRCGQVTKPAPSRSRGRHGRRTRSRSGAAHAPSPDVRCGPPGLSLTRKTAALRHPWLRWPPTPAHGARAPPPRTSIRKCDGGSVTKAEGSANFSSAPSRCGQVMKPVPSRSRCAPEVECARAPSRSRSSTKSASSGHASAREPQPLAAVAAAGDSLQPGSVGQIPRHRLLDP